MENDESAMAEEQLPLEGPGQILRRIREAQGLQLEDIAAQTRIPLRHLEKIEQEAFSDLPSRTYAIGFARSYARALGIDENRIAAGVREKLAQQPARQPRRESTFEPGDPARVPPAALAWMGAIAALVLLIGTMAYLASSRGGDVPPVRQQGSVEAGVKGSAGTDASLTGPGAKAPGSQEAQAAGKVVFTARDDGVWVRFYEAGGKRLYEGTMKQGESFEIPVDARDPRIWTGRPGSLEVTLDGRKLPPLGAGDTIIRDVPVSAEALRASGADAGQGAPAASGQGSPGNR